MTSMLIVNVNNCSTSSTALFCEVQAIRVGGSNYIIIIIALGFENMQSGSLNSGTQGRESPMAEIDAFAMPRHSMDVRCRGSQAYEGNMTSLRSTSPR